MNRFYGKGIEVPTGKRLLHGHEQIQSGDEFMADCLDEPMPVDSTIGLRVEETPFVAVLRRKDVA
jgi:hypothetical protein